MTVNSNLFFLLNCCRATSTMVRHPWLCLSVPKIFLRRTFVNRVFLPLLIALILAAAEPSHAQDKPLQITVHWDEVTRVSQTTPTLQVVVNPPLERGTAIHDNVFQTLRDLQADYVRYVPW